MQRLAHEGVGFGTWTHCDGDVPLADAHDKLATIDLEDLNHPKLMALLAETKKAETENASIEAATERNLSRTDSVPASQSHILEAYEEISVRDSFTETRGNMNIHQP